MSSDVIDGFFVLLMILAMYFVPFIVAINRHYHNKLAIFFLNLLLGWTFIGWVIALVWATTQVRREQA